MTVIGRATMEKWKEEGNRVVVYSQGGKEMRGQIIDYDDTEIVLKSGVKSEKIVCHNWTFVQEVSISCHD